MLKSAIVKRLRNKYFIAAMISFGALVYKTVTGTELPADVNSMINTGLAALTFVGIIIDPSTPGITDGGNK